MTERVGGREGLGSRPLREPALPHLDQLREIRPAARLPEQPDRGAQRPGAVAVQDEPCGLALRQETVDERVDALERRSDDGSWVSVPFRLRRECASA